MTELLYIYIELVNQYEETDWFSKLLLWWYKEESYVLTYHLTCVTQSTEYNYKFGQWTKELYVHLHGTHILLYKDFPTFGVANSTNLIVANYKRYLIQP
jgi:hypothetical protein